MAVLTNSILIVLLYFLKKRKNFINFFGIGTMAVLYVMCIIRMIVPVENVDFQHVIDDKIVYGTFLNTLDYFNANEVFFSDVFWIVTLCIWAASVLIVALFKFLRYRRSVKYFKNAENCADEFTQFCFELAKKKKNIKKDVKLLVSDSINMPMSYGLLKPTVLLPTDFYEETELEQVLIHELCHIKNNDVLLHILIELYCCVFWWNPLTYLLKKDLEFLLEARCDRTVIKGGSKEDFINYTNALTYELARRGFNDEEDSEEADTALFFGNKKKKAKKNEALLIKRFELLDYEKKRKPKERILSALVLVAAAAVMFASYYFIWQPAADPSIEDLISGFDESISKAIAENPDSIESIDENNSYILKTKDGTYQLVYDDEVMLVFSDSDIENGALNGYTVVEE